MGRRHGVYLEGDTWIVYIKNQAITYTQNEVEAQNIFEQEVTTPGSAIPWRKSGTKVLSLPKAPSLPATRMVANNNNRAEKMNASGKITVDEWTQLCDNFGNYCISCGFPWKLTIDHVIPLVLGGTNTIDNIQPLCRSCNSSKHSKIIDYRLFPAQRRYLDCEK